MQLPMISIGDIIAIIADVVDGNIPLSLLKPDVKSCYYKNINLLIYIEYIWRKA